jgi:hypothetical protein
MHLTYERRVPGVDILGVLCVVARCAVVWLAARAAASTSSSSGERCGRTVRRQGSLVGNNEYETNV